VYKTPPQRRRRDRGNGGGAATPEELNSSPEKKPMMDLRTGDAAAPPPEPLPPTAGLRFNHNNQHHLAHTQSPNSAYGNSPTLADFKQMAFDAYNQRNNQNVRGRRDLSAFTPRRLIPDRRIRHPMP
jgi:hypothetical protein